MDYTNIGDDVLKQVGQLKTLKILSLSETKITNAGMPHLNDLEDLHVLYLGYTKVGPRSLAKLTSLKNLARLYVVSLRLTLKQVEAFEKSHPRCTVMGGWIRHDGK